MDRYGKDFLEIMHLTEMLRVSLIHFSILLSLCIQDFAMTDIMP